MGLMKKTAEINILKEDMEDKVYLESMTYLFKSQKIEKG